MIELKDVLSGALFFGALLAWLAWRETRGRGRYGVALALVVAAMLAKSSAVVWPVVAAVVVWWRHGRLTRRDIAELLPFVAVVAVTAAVDYAVFLTHATEKANLALAARLPVAGRAWWFYLGDFVWPWPQMAIYPRWEVAGFGAAQWLWPVGAMAVLAGVILSVPRIGRSPAAALGWFTVAMAPVAGLLTHSFMAYSFVADRFSYLPHVGLAALAGGAMVAAARRFAPAPRRVMATAIMGTVVLVPLGAACFVRAAKYRDMETLFADNIAKAPGVWAAHYQLARALSDKRSAG